MMDNACSIQEETVHLYLDKALPPPEWEAFAAHLPQCPACQTRLADLQSLFAELMLLDDVDAPVDLASQVMATLPAPAASARFVSPGLLALAAQLSVGVLIAVAAWPVITSTTTYPVQQFVLTLSQIVLSLNGWLNDVIAGLNNLIPARWPPAGPVSGLDISPAIIALLIIGLGLAWLIGNTILLRQNPSSFKNGGAS